MSDSIGGSQNTQLKTGSHTSCLRHYGTAAAHLRSLKALRSGDEPRPKAVYRSPAHLHFFVCREPTSFAFFMSFAVEVVVLGRETQAFNLMASCGDIAHPSHPKHRLSKSQGRLQTADYVSSLERHTSRMELVSRVPALMCSRLSLSILKRATLSSRCI